MPFFAPNPNVVAGAPVAMPPPPQPAPGSNFLMQQYWAAKRAAPWLFPQGGILNQTPYQEPMIDGAPYSAPKRGLLSPVADIYSFTKKGLLGTPGPEMGGRRGMLGGGRYNFRDPASVAQFEKDRGLPPGSIKPVEGQMGTISKLTTQPEMKRMMKQPLTKEGQKTVDDMLREGPTPAQMARPVKQTPEISAKLAEARARRAAQTPEARAKRAALIDKAVERASKVPPAKDKLPSFDDWAAKHVGADYLGRLNKSELDSLRRAYNTFVLREPK